MNSTINIRLSKKDSQLIEWWDEMAKRECNISQTIHLAILYYIYTGEYLTIAKIKKSNIPKETVSKKIYLRENTEVFSYLSDMQEQKVALSQLIRGILKQGIQETTEETTITELDKLVLLVEQAKNNRSPAAGSGIKEVYPNSPQNQSTYTPTKETAPKYMQYHKTNQAAYPEEDPVTSYSTYEEQEENAAPDLFDILGGSYKLQI